MGTRSAADAVRHRSARQLTPRPSLDRWTGRSGGRRWRLLRRLLAVLLLIGAGVSAAADVGGDPGDQVLALRTDLPLGTILTSADVMLISMRDPPDGVLRESGQVVGQRLAAPARRGEVLTDVRLVGPDGPDPGPGRTAVTVRLSDPAVAQLLRPGITVSLIGVSSDGVTNLLTGDALTLAILDESTLDGTRSGRNSPILFSVPNGNADRVTGGSFTGEITVRFT